MRSLLRLLLPLISLSLLQSCAKTEYPVIVASIETEPVLSNGDAADDPAIWIHPRNSAKSLVLATNKQAGLEVYDLSGRRVQTLDIGRLNNIDIRQEVLWGNEVIDLAVATNRTQNRLDLFTIDRSIGTVKLMEDHSIALTMNDPYGTCLFKQEQVTYAFVNDKNGVFQQWLLMPGGRSELVRDFQVDSQPEGCVADDEMEALYYGEESVGLWKRSALPGDGDEPRLISDVRMGPLVADVEGVAIYTDTLDEGYIVVSSQGDDSYAIFERNASNGYVGSFRIGITTDSLIDGTSDTDGVAITNIRLNSSFPHGMLVVQDGSNTAPDEKQNFKYVDWRSVEAMIDYQEKYGSKFLANQDNIQ